MILVREAQVIINDLDSLIQRIEMIQMQMDKPHPNYTQAIDLVRQAKDQMQWGRTDIIHIQDAANKIDMVKKNGK